MRRLGRLIRIIFILSKYRLDELVHTSPLPLRIKLLFSLSPARLLPIPPLSRAERLRLSLEELGPIFIKFGQMLSTRRDLLPDDIADELQKLQDQVPPFDGAIAIKLIEEALQQPVDQLFAEFDPTPLASASVAQVHTATLPTGEKVVVKVIRPGAHQIIAQDIGLLFILARFAEKYSADGRRLRPIEVVNDYQRTIFNELDLLIEAGNTSQLRRNFQDSQILYIPQVYWDYTRQNVLVIEQIHGIPVADIPALERQSTDMRKLAERGVEIFFTQVFRDSFFHADMHPGNIFVATENPADPHYIAIDCAIVGSLTNDDKVYLARMLLAFFKRNYRQVAQLHIDSGWVPEHTPVNEFETAIRSVCEPIFEKPLKDISFGQILLRLFQTARQFDMEVQPQLVLLQKTLLNIEGLGRQIYPDLDLWHTAKPFMESWMKERTGPPGILKAVREQGPDWLEQSIDLPQVAIDIVQQFRHLRSYSEQHQETLQLLEQQLQRDKQRSRNNWIGIALIAGAVILATDLASLTNNIPATSWILGLFGTVMLLKR